MKPGHKKTRSEYPHDLKTLQERVNHWKLPDGPFDYAIRGKAVAEAQGFYNEASKLRKLNLYDSDLSELQSRAINLWRLALDAAYPTGFWQDYQRLRAGDVTGLESAIVFLEADPIFFRSGYVKTKLMRYMKRSMMTPPRAARLRSVILSLVDRRDDRDFRAFCNLAHKVDAPELRTALTQRLTNSDANIRRRARWVLDALDAGAAQQRDTS